MFSTLRNRFGIPGVISVIALVFAMFGGAYAASNSSDGKNVTASAKKKAAKGPRGPRGATGPAGPAGVAGAAGPKGDTGAAGSNGSNGADGKNGVSVTTEEFTGVKEGHCAGVGGTKLTSSSGNTFVCNGKEGSPWTVGGTLPSGETETGTYSGYVRAGPEASEWNQLFLPISFALPVQPAPAAHYVEGPTTECPGVISGVPTAEPGHLCVYKNLATAGEPQGFLNPSSDPNVFALGTSPAGTVYAVLCKFSSCTWQGTWAVTAE